MVGDPRNVERYELLGEVTNDRGQRVEKYRLRDDNGRTKGIQYKICHRTAFILVRGDALMDMADLLDDACEAIEKGTFPETESGEA